MKSRNFCPSGLFNIFPQVALDVNSAFDIYLWTDDSGFALTWPLRLTGRCISRKGTKVWCGRGQLWLLPQQPKRLTIMYLSASVRDLHDVFGGGWKCCEGGRIETVVTLFGGRVGVASFALAVMWGLCVLKNKKTSVFVCTNYVLVIVCSGWVMKIILAGLLRS